MHILDKIFLALEERNFSQQDLSDALEVDKSIISAWKSGKTKSYNRYLPKIAAFLNVTEDWLLGNTKYQRPELAAKLRWNISTVDGFDPVFDFGPIIKGLREEKGISEATLAKKLSVPASHYQYMELGEVPLAQFYATLLCNELDTSIECVLKNNCVFSDKPVEKKDTDDTSMATEYISVDAFDRTRIRNNITYFANEQGDSLADALKKIGTSEEFAKSLTRGYSLATEDLLKVTWHYNLNYYLLIGQDLTKQTGRILARLMKEKNIDTAANGINPIEWYEMGFSPDSRELQSVARALGMDILELPIPFEEMTALTLDNVGMRLEDFRLLSGFHKLDATGKEKLLSYMQDISKLYKK